MRYLFYFLFLFSALSGHSQEAKPDQLQRKPSLNHHVRPELFRSLGVSKIHVHEQKGGRQYSYGIDSAGMCVGFREVLPSSNRNKSGLREERFLPDTLLNTFITGMGSMYLEKYRNEFWKKISHDSKDTTYVWLYGDSLTSTRSAETYKISANTGDTVFRAVGYFVNGRKKLRATDDRENGTYYSEKYRRNKEGVLIEYAVESRDPSLTEDKIDLSHIEYTKTSCLKKVEWSVLTERDEMYGASRIGSVFPLSGKGQLAIRHRYNQLGDQFQYTRLGTDGDTLEHILLDSTFLYPKRHFLNAAGEKYELVKVHKRLRKGARMVTRFNCDDDVIERSFLRVDNGEVISAQSCSKERFALVQRTKNGIIKKVAFPYKQGEFFSQRSMRNSNLNWEMMKNGSAYRVAYNGDSLKMSTRHYKFGEGFDLIDVNGKRCLRRVLKRYICIGGDTVILDDWFIAKEHNFINNRPKSRFELNPDVLQSVNSFTESLSKGRDEYLYLQSKQTYNQKGELVRGLSVSKYQRRALNCEYAEDSSLLIMRNYIWYDPLIADSVLFQEIWTWNAPFIQGARKGQVKKAYERTGELKSTETRTTTYDVLGRLVKEEITVDNGTSKQWEQRKVQRTLITHGGRTVWTERKTETIVYKEGAVPSISVQYEETEYGPSGNVLSYSEGWLKDGQKEESKRIAYTYLKTGLLIRVDSYDDGVLEKVTHCTYEYGYE